MHLVTAGIFKTGDALSLKCLAVPSLHHEICILSSNIYSLSLSNIALLKIFAPTNHTTNQTMRFESGKKDSS